jgi:hypothetical protein
MKKIMFLILAILLLFSVTQAQKVNRGFASTVDTLQAADSLYFAHTSIITEYAGIVSFTFTMTNTADSCNNVILQGSNNNSNFFAVSPLADTDVTSGILYDLNPDYLYYRLFMSTAAGDTVIVTSVNFVWKEY